MFDILTEATYNDSILFSYWPYANVKMGKGDMLHATLFSGLFVHSLDIYSYAGYCIQLPRRFGNQVG